MISLHRVAALVVLQIKTTDHLGNVRGSLKTQKKLFVKVPSCEIH